MYHAQTWKITVLLLVAVALSILMSPTAHAQGCDMGKLSATLAHKKMLRNKVVDPSSYQKIFLPDCPNVRVLYNKQESLGHIQRIDADIREFCSIYNKSEKEPDISSMIEFLVNAGAKSTPFKACRVDIYDEELFSLTFNGKNWSAYSDGLITRFSTTNVIIKINEDIIKTLFALVKEKNTTNALVGTEGIIAENANGSHYTDFDLVGFSLLCDLEQVNGRIAKLPDLITQKFNLRPFSTTESMYHSVLSRNQNFSSFNYHFNCL